MTDSMHPKLKQDPEADGGMRNVACLIGPVPSFSQTRPLIATQHGPFQISSFKSRKALCFMKHSRFQQQTLFPSLPEGKAFGPSLTRWHHVGGEESPEGMPAMPGASAEHLREWIRFHSGATFATHPTHFQSHSTNEDVTPQVITGKAIHDYALPVPRCAA